MNKIKGWYNFFESVSLTDDEKSWVSWAIKDAVQEIWGDINSNEIISKHDFEMKSELLRKSKNNKLLLDFLNLKSGCVDKYNLKKWIKKNAWDIFHPKGQYFEKVMEILIETSKKGERMEKLATECIVDYYTQMDKEINTFKPSVERDIEGYDIFFRVDDKIRSAQIKTLKNISVSGDWVKVYCRGHITDMSTNFIVAVNEKECYIFRSFKYIKKEGHYVLPKRSLVYHKKLQQDENQLSLGF